MPAGCRNSKRLPEFEHVEKILPVEIRDAAQLAAYEEDCLAEGYEGVMIRTPDSPYKCGRSTEREGWLLKIKRFEDAEAVVLDTYEGMSNHNEAQRDAFGRTKRSSAQAGKVGRGELGGFVVSAVDSNVVFRLGYNHVLGGVDRVTLWEQRESLGGPPREVQTPAERGEGSAAFPQVHRLPRGVGFVSTHLSRQPKAAPKNGEKYGDHFGFPFAGRLNEARACLPPPPPPTTLLKDYAVCVVSAAQGRRSHEHPLRR